METLQALIDTAGIKAEVHIVMSDDHQHRGSFIAPTMADLFARVATEEAQSTAITKATRQAALATSVLQFSEMFNKNVMKHSADAELIITNLPPQLGTAPIDYVRILNTV